AVTKIRVWPGCVCQPVLPPSCHTLIRTAPSDNPFVHCRDSQTCESGRTKLLKILNWSNWPWARGVLVNALAGVDHAGLACKRAVTMSATLNNPTHVSF